MNIALRRMRLAPQAAARQESSGGLAVAGLRAWAVREPVSKRAYTIVRVETRSGQVGWGECGPAEPGAAARAAAIVTGQPATAYEVIKRQLGPALAPAVDMALLDILGKQAKAPVYQVLGGPTRNKARALTPVNGTPQAVKRAREAGFRAFLVAAPEPAWPNSGQQFIRAVRARLDAARDAAPDCDFVLDGAGRLTPGDAASLAAELERFHLLWFDEPCRTSNLSTIRKISTETVTPLGFGRHVQQAGDFQDLLREEAVDVLRPSLALNGISKIRRMAALAETYYVAVAPYTTAGRSLRRRHCTWPPACPTSSSSRFRCRWLKPTGGCGPSWPPARSRRFVTASPNC